ncbi:MULTISPECIES: pyridoxal phosphate-dependent aminotransferase [Cupriavidus]
MNLTRESILAMPDSPIAEVWRLGAGRHDVIGLWAGESDLPTPRPVCDAAAAALAGGQTFYAQNRGIPALREAIAAYYLRLDGVAVADERIAVTCAGMNAVMLAAQALIEPGDNAVCVVPSWPNILRAIAIAGGEVRTVSLTHDGDGWHLDLDRLMAACDARTRAICYASPGNPTGWIIDEAQQRALMAFSRARGITIVADEVYQRIVYDRTHAPSMLRHATPDDPLIVINSFSKAWAMTGWRLGWAVYPRGMLGTFEKLIQFNTSGGQAFLQMGAAVALNDGEPFVRAFVERCRGGQRIALERLRAMPGVTVVPSQASFYLMFGVEGVTDTLDFCKRAVHEAGVGLAPGTAFGAACARQIRLCYARSDASLIEAMDRLARFVRA